MISDLLDNEIPIYDALNIIVQEGKGVYSKSFIKSVSLLASKMKSNSSLSAALLGLVPDNEVKMISIAETSGKVSEGMKGISQSIKQKDMIRNKLLSSVIGPFIMFTLSLVVIAGYSVKVFPAFENVLPVNSWPLVTSVLYSFGTNLFHGLWAYILLFFIALSLLTAIVARNVTGGIRNNFLDYLPPFRYIKLTTSLDFLLSMSTMLKNKLPFHESLEVLNNDVSTWYGWHLNLMDKAMQAGLDYKSVLNTGLLSNRVILILAVYSRMSNFSDVMHKLAMEANSDILSEIEKLSIWLKNLSLLLLGATVSWIFGALYALIDIVSSNPNMM